MATNGRAGFQLADDHVIERQRELHAAPCGLGLDAARRVELLVFDERLADRDAARLEERVGHRAADEQAVDFAQHVLDDLDLVRHLRAAQDRDKRPLRCFERVAEILQFLLHQQTGRRPGKMMGDALNRGVRAVRSAEGVVDVAIGQ